MNKLSNIEEKQLEKLEKDYKEFLKYNNIKDVFKEHSKGMFIQDLVELPTDKVIREFMNKEY